jgi:hypothetical protein
VSQPAPSDRPPRHRADGHAAVAGARQAIATARRRYEGSWFQDLATGLKGVDFGNAIVLFGSSLLLCLLPLIILLGTVANDRIDDDLSRHIGLNTAGAQII